MQRPMAPESKSGSGFILGASNGVPLQGILFRDSDSIPLRFRRLRSGRACLICHARKVRCDASSRGMPCTNCAAFSFECTIPQKRQKRTARSQPDISKRKEVEPSTSEVATPGNAVSTYVSRKESITASEPSRDVQFVPPTQKQLEEHPDPVKILAQFISESHEASIKSPGRVAYVAELSNLSMLVHGYNTPTSIVHYSGDLVKSNRLDESELDILRRRGALTLPPREVCDDLVKAYFKWVAPMVPIIDRKRFMEQYRDPSNPPSLLLLQAIFLAASRACQNDQLKDSNGSKIPASIAFYKRARALYEAHYEDDRVTIVQALTLISMYRDRTEKVNKNTFYWTGLAVSIAQGFGMHRNAEASSLSMADKRLWKRIWWTLFTRDRSSAIVFGQPVLINLESSDIDMVSEDDFLDDMSSQFTSSRTARLQVQFFLHYVKLCKIMDSILLWNYSTESSIRPQNAKVLEQRHSELTQWLQNCPEELKWHRANHNFWAAQLSAMYHTANCLLFRTHLPTGAARVDMLIKNRRNYSSCSLRSPIFQSAYAITSITESLSDYNELRYSHPFFMFSLSTVLIVHLYEMYAVMPAIDVNISNRIRICGDALDRLGETWLVAQKLYNLLKSLLTGGGLVNCLEDVDQETRQNTGPGNDGGPAKVKTEPPAESEFSPGDWQHPKPTISLSTPVLADMLATLSLCTSSESERWTESNTKAVFDQHFSSEQNSISESSTDASCSPLLDNREAQSNCYISEDSSQQLSTPDESLGIQVPQPFMVEAFNNSNGILANPHTTSCQVPDLQGHLLYHDNMPMKTLDAQLQYLPSEFDCPQYNSFTNEVRVGTGGPRYLENAVYMRPLTSVEFGMGEWIPDFDCNNFQ